MFKEFREFAMKGNVVDLAVGVIIGGASGKIVTSMVEDILMPPIGMLMGNVDFKNLAIWLTDALDEKGGHIGPAIRYGKFINTVLDFLIVAFCIFIVVKQMNRLRSSDAKK